MFRRPRPAAVIGAVCLGMSCWLVLGMLADRLMPPPREVVEGIRHLIRPPGAGSAAVAVGVRPRRDPGRVRGGAVSRAHPARPAASALAGAGLRDDGHPVRRPARGRLALRPDRAARRAAVVGGADLGIDRAVDDHPHRQQHHPDRARLLRARRGRRTPVDAQRLLLLVGAVTLLVAGFAAVRAGRQPSAAPPQILYAERHRCQQSHNYFLS